MPRFPFFFALQTAALIVLAACGGSQTTPTPEPLEPTEPTDALTAANGTFRALYVENRLERLSHSGDAIVVQFDDLVLFRDGSEVERATFTLPLYHDLKSIAHIPLAVVVVCANALDGTGDGTWRSELERLREAIEPLDDAFLADRFPADLVDDQREVLRVSRDAIAAMLALEHPQEAELASFAQQAMPIVMRNADRAGQMQLDGLHSLVQDWRSDMGEDAWSHLNVIVLGPKAPREGNLQFEYFVRAMGEETVGDRLVYAEGMFDPDSGMNLLGTLLQDRAASELFFADRFRLDRDLLADAATAHLDRIFGQAP